MRHFSDAGSASGDSFDAFIGRGLPRLYALTPLSPFFLDSWVVRIGRLAIIYVDIAGQRWSRSAAQLQTAPDDAFCVNISLGIEADGMAGDRHFHQSAGSAVMTDLAQPSIHESTDGQSIQLVLPRALAEAAGIDVAASHGRILSAGVVRILTSHLLNIRHSIAHFDTNDAPYIERTILDLLVIAINATGRVAQRKSPKLTDPTAEKILQEIRDHLGSPLLTATHLCRKMGISRSKLHRIFEAEGGVQAFIRNARLDAARLQLVRGGDKGRIVDIAERLGFADAAHFSRAFRERFGQTPTEFRRNFAT